MNKIILFGADSSFDSVFAPLVQHSTSGFIFDHIVWNVNLTLIDGENAELISLNANDFKQFLSKIGGANLGKIYNEIDSIMPNFKETIASQLAVPIIMLHLEYDKLRTYDSTLLCNKTVSEANKNPPHPLTPKIYFADKPLSNIFALPIDPTL
ncbi:MAG: hypothetical protein LAT54_00435 [Cryomorphaceae bacterium]|nr:hypothetical protein [Cryomorphaceae bacterium]